jgi:hypothetical protein
MQDSESALRQIADQLRRDDSVISSHVVDSAQPLVFGPLAAAGPRASADPAEYCLVVESIREGYELHYGTPRLLAGHDDNLALLAGDYLYALGLERLAALGDGEAVAELSDLISISAASHAEGAEELAAPLWLASAVAVGCGGGEAHRAAKEAARSARPEAAAALIDSARRTAAEAGLDGALDRAAEGIDFAAPADRG